MDSKTGQITASHQWKSQPLKGGQAWIALAWNSPVDVSEIHLTFDTNFGRQLCLSPNDYTNNTVIRAAQPETVKDYAIVLDGKEVLKVTGNYSRKRVHTLAKPQAAKSLKVVVTATNGVEEARIFEIGVF
jgi:hypothetical protein